LRFICAFLPPVCVCWLFFALPVELAQFIDLAELVVNSPSLPFVPRACRGFSLVELLLVIVVLGVVLAFAIPSMRSMIQNNRLKSATSTLIMALNLARSEAVARNKPVILCRATAADGTGCDQPKGTFELLDGVLVKEKDTNGKLLLRSEAIVQGIRIETDMPDLQFNGSGSLAKGINITLVNTDDNNRQRVICVGRFGQITTDESGTCP